MGTPKRERQKENRRQRILEEQKEYRVATAKRNTLRWGLIGLAAVGAVVLIAWAGGAFSGDDTADDPQSGATATTVTATTVPAATTVPVTYETPPTPSVSVPAELPTELVVTHLADGSGPEAVDGDTVVVHYIGVRSADGTEFDSSYGRGSPFPVKLGAGTVIQGWDQGLVGAQKGDRIQLDIPAGLAYGDRGAGSLIKPGDALTFVVDVLDVIPATTP